MTNAPQSAPDRARRRLTKTLLGAPVLMSIPGRQVFAGACTLSGMMSGNVSGSSDDCANLRAYGRDPEFWTSLDNPCLIERKRARFRDHFGSRKFGRLSLYEVLKISVHDPDYCDTGFMLNTSHDASHENSSSHDDESHDTDWHDKARHDDDDHKAKERRKRRRKKRRYARYRNYCHYQWAELELARLAITAYLNAYDARHGGGNVDPDYPLTPEQVVGLYLAAEAGGGIYQIGGNDYYFSREAVMRIFENSWL